jgi:hypothetical protein
LIGAALFALLELVSGIVIAGFFERGRADLLLFLAFRPWLIVAGAALVAAWPLRRRLGFYALALLLAAASEAILLAALDAPAPWEEMLSGLAGGTAMAAIADLSVQMARRWRPLAGTLAAFAALAAALALGAARPYEALVLGATAPQPQAAPKPALALMSALPLAWGEGGAFDPASRPAESYRLLEREFDLRLLDALEPQSLRGVRLMLLAQPRQLTPEELVALDQWVRNGGSALILTDPELSWAADWPPGHVLRPPQTGLLGPLLDHWGLAVQPSEPAGLVEDALGTRGRRLVLQTPGLVQATGPQCRVAARFYLARCRIGRGETILLADADLLADRLWTGTGPRRSERHLRTADNPLVIADLLDGLAGLSRERADQPVTWLAVASADSARRRAPWIAALPILIVLASGLGLLYARRRASTNLSTGQSTVNNTRTKDLESP